MRFLIAGIVFLISSAAFAQEHAERFDYDVNWGYADVAQVTLQQGCAHDGYRPAKLTAKSLGVAEQLHAFEIRLDSFLGLDGRTLEGRTFIEEEGVPRKYRTRFAANGAAEARRDYAQKTSTLNLKLRPGAFDLLSWAFALRAEKLTEGAEFVYYVWDGWKLTRVTARVDKPEVVWTPVATFDAVRVSLTRVRLHHAGAKAYQPRAATEKLGVIWLNRDPRRTPVAMDFGAPVGIAKLRLSRSTVKACP